MMQLEISHILPVVFGVVAVAYLGLSGHAFRNGQGLAHHSISFLLFLVGAFVAGAALWYQTDDMTLFRIGRILTMFAAGFMPVGLYLLYREYAGDRPSTHLVLMLAVIPAVTTGLAVTNPWHGLLWEASLVDGTVEFSHVRDHAWFRLIALPFTYSLFGYSLLALAGRLPTMARAHRSRIVLLLFCAVMPFLVNIANTILDIGPYEFPFTATTLVVLLPVYWWAAVRLGRSNFKPVAYQTLFDHVRDAIIVLDDEQRIVSANRKGEELLGATEAALVGQPIEKCLPEIAQMLGEGGGPDLTRSVRLDGSRYLELSAAALSGLDGEIHGTVVVCRDITERRQTQRALADSEQLIRSLVEHSSNGMLRFARDKDGFRCSFANRAAARFLDASDRELVGASLEEFPTLKPDVLLSHFQKSEAERNASIFVEAEVEAIAGGRWLRLVAEPVGDDFSVTLIDITQSKEDESRILAEALQDPLTGVLNRRGFEESAPALFASHERGAVVYLDLDGFKSVNDSFGHQAGDALLKAFSHRVAFCLRPEDMVARLGGDEFAILLPGISEEHARAVAERLVDSASEPYVIQGERIRCVASVGIALKPRHGTELPALISLADQAMYAAKAKNSSEAANDRLAYGEASAAV